MNLPSKQLHYIISINTLVNLFILYEQTPSEPAGLPQNHTSTGDACCGNTPHLAERKTDKEREREREGWVSSICLRNLPGANYPNPRNPGCGLVACATSQDTSVLPPS